MLIFEGLFLLFKKYSTAINSKEGHEPTLFKVKNNTIVKGL